MSEHCVADWPLVETLAWIACAMVYSLNLESHCVEQTARRDVSRQYCQQKKSPLAVLSQEKFTRQYCQLYTTSIDVIIARNASTAKLPTVTVMDY